MTIITIISVTITITIIIAVVNEKIKTMNFI